MLSIYIYFGVDIFLEKYFDNWTNVKLNFLKKLKIYLFYWIFNDKIYSKVRFGRPQNDKTNKQHSLIPLYLGRFGTNYIYLQLLKIKKNLLKRKQSFVKENEKSFELLKEYSFGNETSNLINIQQTGSKATLILG